jgi:hypothetical protein
MVKLEYCILTVIHSCAIMPHVLAANHPIAPPFVRFFFPVCTHRLSVQLSRSAFQLFTPGIPSLPRKESASISFHGLYTSFVFILLRTLLHCEKRYPHSFQYLPHSLAKTPGWGGHVLQTEGSRISPEAPRITIHGTPITALVLYSPLVTHPIRFSICSGLPKISEEITGTRASFSPPATCINRAQAGI